MKFRSDFLDALKLSFLIIILIWSFTWNSNYEYTHSSSDNTKVRSSKVSQTGKFSSMDTLRKNFVPGKSTPALNYKSEKSTKAATVTDGIIPPFNEWKEMEKVKYEQKYATDPPFFNPKTSGKRKLNYASSKCGAKILASNLESRHRVAILNEKPDEYMMNPCRVRTWFIIELCDTVEATQIEIANYELYSSSPREFSVFWSEIYPTTEWRLLGTFEAKDRRTMQTFDLSLKNLGKFVKVIIYNHHGREHFCLLSVIRIVGYSMVEKFEDLQKSSESPQHNDNLPRKTLIRNLTLENKTVAHMTTKESDAGYANIASAKMCSAYFTACKHRPGFNSETVSLNELKCRFFSAVIKNFSLTCERNFCSKRPIASKYKCDSKTKAHLTRKDTKERYLEDKNTLPPYRYFFKNEDLKPVPKVERFDSKDSDRTLQNDSFKLHSSRSANVAMQNAHKKLKGSKCTCDAKIAKMEVLKETSSEESLFEETEKQRSDNVDSAGLIQKESVLYKLTTRIKASEIDLNLINRYLQQLSQSYRQQMQDLQAMFNETVKAIHVASEMSIKIERRQQESINNLQQQVTSLTRKVEYLMSGQHNMMNRVVEMHVFFIILEIIILSTIFTIFLNLYNRKKSTFDNQPYSTFL